MFQRTIAVLMIVAAASAAAAVGAPTSTPPQRGGTLQILGTSDVSNLDPLSGYATLNNLLERGFARSLFGYRNAASFPAQTALVPDVAAALPTIANGGVSRGGTVYTIHLKKGVMWDTTPPRQVTASDFVREFKLMCNPAAPVGAPGYFESTIVGMTSYCAGFAKVKATPQTISAYVNVHALSGVTAKGQLTVVFRLLAPAPDFLNILAMGFSSARPVEYMSYVPDSAQLRQHTISDGPYTITRYDAGKEIDLARNPAWNPQTDPLRHAYVDVIKVTEGLTGDSVQQQLEAGTGDLEWDTPPPSQRMPALLSAHDTRLIIGPPGTYYSGLLYFALNQYAGPFSNKLVREAAEYALDRNAIVRILGGPLVATPATQVILPGNVGYVPQWEPFPDGNGNGDTAKAKALLAAAGHPNGLPVKLVVSQNEPNPRIAQSAQASLAAAGFHVTLVQTTLQDLYGKYLYVPSTAKSDAWDLALTGWIPDWFGNNGRTTLQPLFTAPGPGSADFGGYHNATVDALVRGALRATTPAAASLEWARANRAITSDAAALIAAAQKWPIFHSSRVQGCVWWVDDLNCDPTNVWLKR
jgi:ABC-type transport system substrate-binding protein